MSRYSVSIYTDGPATRWNVIDLQTQEWLGRFTSEKKAREHIETLETKKDPNEGRDGFELYEGKWRKVMDGSRSGWWRFNEHYDRDGYCDNPGRGY